MRRSYMGYGYYGGMGQAPGTPVSSATTISLPAGVSLPGPETWGNDPTAIALQQMGGSKIAAPYLIEDQFVTYAIEAMMQTGQIHPSNVDAAENACWTCAYVYAYNSVNQLIASGASFTGSGGQLAGGTILGSSVPQLLGGSGQGQTTSVKNLIHGMYNQLRIATYAIAYYWNCQLNSIKGLNCTGGVKSHFMSVASTPLVSLKPSVAAPMPAAAGAAASSKTGLLLGGLAIAGAAAYFLL